MSRLLATVMVIFPVAVTVTPARMRTSSNVWVPPGRIVSVGGSKTSKGSIRPVGAGMAAWAENRSPRSVSNRRGPCMLAAGLASMVRHKTTMLQILRKPCLIASSSGAQNWPGTRKTRHTTAVAGLGTAM